MQFPLHAQHPSPISLSSPQLQSQLGRPEQQVPVGDARPSNLVPQMRQAPTQYVPPFYYQVPISRTPLQLQGPNQTHGTSEQLPKWTWSEQQSAQSQIPPRQTMYTGSNQPIRPHQLLSQPRPQQQSYPEQDQPVQQQ